MLLLLPNVESKRHHDPIGVCVERIAHERVISQQTDDSNDVVFHVFPVVRKVWITPAFTRREQNVQTPAGSTESQPRPQRRLLRFLNQGALELANKFTPTSPLLPSGLLGPVALKFPVSASCELK